MLVQPLQPSPAVISVKGLKIQEEISIKNSKLIVREYLFHLADEVTSSHRAGLAKLAEYEGSGLGETRLR